MLIFRKIMIGVDRVVIPTTMGFSTTQ